MNDRWSVIGNSNSHLHSISIDLLNKIDQSILNVKHVGYDLRLTVESIINLTKEKYDQLFNLIKSAHRG